MKGFPLYSGESKYLIHCRLFAPLYIGQRVYKCGRDMTLWTLMLGVAIVQGDELAQLALPRSSSAASFKPISKVPLLMWICQGQVTSLRRLSPSIRCTSHIIHLNTLISKHTYIYIHFTCIYISACAHI